jgi:hypothetical protein
MYLLMIGIRPTPADTTGDPCRIVAIPGSNRKEGTPKEKPMTE